MAPLPSNNISVPEAAGSPTYLNLHHNANYTLPSALGSLQARDANEAMIEGLLVCKADSSYGPELIRSAHPLEPFNFVKLGFIILVFVVLLLIAHYKYDMENTLSPPYMRRHRLSRLRRDSEANVQRRSNYRSIGEPAEVLEQCTLPVDVARLLSLRSSLGPADSHLFDAAFQCNCEICQSDLERLARSRAQQRVKYTRYSQG